MLPQAKTLLMMSREIVLASEAPRGGAFVAHSRRSLTCVTNHDTGAADVNTKLWAPAPRGAPRGGATPRLSLCARPAR